MAHPGVPAHRHVGGQTLTFALIAGLAFAVVAAAIMLPIPFPTIEEKRTAILAAFLDRLFVGFVIGPAASGLHANGLLLGAILGLGLSVPTAIITKSYPPVLGLGLVGGLAVGFAFERAF